MDEKAIYCGKKAMKALREGRTKIRKREKSKNLL